MKSSKTPFNVKLELYQFAAEKIKALSDRIAELDNQYKDPTTNPHHITSVLMLKSQAETERYFIAKLMSDYDDKHGSKNNG